MSKSSANEPHWEPLPRQHFTLKAQLGIVLRHLVPVLGVFIFGWSAAQFLILSVFNVCFSVVCIGVVGVAVSTRQLNGPGLKVADQIGTWLTCLALAVIGSVVLTAMFGWVIALFAVSGGEALFNVSLVSSALMMVAFAVPGLYKQYQADLAADLDEEQRKKRDQPNILVLVLTAGLIFILSGYAPDFGRFGLIVMVIAVTALFLFRDLRPDLMRELARPSNMPPTKS